MELETWE